jgi:hypothetical protein
MIGRTIASAAMRRSPRHRAALGRAAALSPAPRRSAAWLALLLALLASVPGKGRPKVVGQSGLFHELFEFLALAIGEGVHGIDHDGPGTRRFASGASPYIPAYDEVVRAVVARENVQSRRRNCCGSRKWSLAEADLIVPVRRARFIRAF